MRIAVIVAGIALALFLVAILAVQNHNIFSSLLKNQAGATREANAIPLHYGGEGEACIVPVGTLNPFNVSLGTVKLVIAEVLNVSPISFTGRLENGSLVEVLIDGKWNASGQVFSGSELAKLLANATQVLVEGSLEPGGCEPGSLAVNARTIVVNGVTAVREA